MLNISEGCAWGPPKSVAAPKDRANPVDDGEIHDSQRDSHEDK